MAAIAPSEERAQRIQLSNIPIPDPSEVTRQAIQALREEVRRDGLSQAAILTTRLDAMDKAVEQAAATTTTAVNAALQAQKEAAAEKYQSVEYAITKIESTFDKQLAHLQKLHEEKFGEKFISIQKQFDERDVRTEQAAIATKIAVDAALQAQKEAAGAQNDSNLQAVSKSEAATVKQIDALQALMKGSNDATNAMIVDIKGRVDRGEGSTRGVRDSGAERRGNVAMVVGVASLASVVISMLVGGVLFIAVHASAPAPAPYGYGYGYGAPPAQWPTAVPTAPGGAPK